MITLKLLAALAAVIVSMSVVRRNVASGPANPHCPAFCRRLRFGRHAAAAGGSPVGPAENRRRHREHADRGAALPRPARS